MASSRTPSLAARLAAPFARFAALEASSALALLLASVLALLAANSPWGPAWQAFWQTPIALSVGDAFELSLSLGAWVNDGLMGVFFFVIGLEIKREVLTGELSSLRRALLPVAGALGGMVVPAAIYAAFHAGQPTLRGFGIPMATDIAFAVGALALLGSRVAPGLRVFLLALAIADDLGAVTVIAMFYSEHIHLAALGLAGAGLAACYALNLAGVRSLLVYLVVGAFVWYETHHSGVHATMAGVALGFLTPARPETEDHETLVARGREALERIGRVLRREGAPQERDQGGHARHHALRELRQVGREALSPLDFLANELERWVAFAIMPIFALANAGVALDPSVLGDPSARLVGFAVAAGLLLGKPIGILAASFLAVRLGLASLPAGVSWSAVLATGLLAGIGFTVSLFVTALAFEDPVLVAGGKLGTLGASLVAAVAGLALLTRVLPEREPT
jgi:Na+:H+ antiporter, NhaA family